MAALHDANRTDEVERPEAVARNTRLGLFLFALYLLLYGAFVVASAFAPGIMERTPIAGVNLAVLAGFGLIGAAFVLALLYGWLCRSGAAASRGNREAGE